MPQYVTVPALARALGLHRRTVYNWVREGRIPSERVGRMHLIPASLLATLLPTLDTRAVTE
jgi:excisionase family DNA binding protein